MMEQKKNFRLFSPETEHRGNDKRLTRNMIMEMNLVHSINESNTPTTAAGNPSEKK